MKDGSADQNRGSTYLEKAESTDELTDQEFEDRSRNFKGTTTLPDLAVADIKANLGDFATKKQFDELWQKVDSITRRMNTAALREQDSTRSNEKIKRLENVVVHLQTEFSRLQRQIHCEPRAGDLLESSDDKQPAGTRSQTASKLDPCREECESREVAKRQSKKEKAEDHCLISKLRLELKEKQKAADEEREESERKDLKIDLLREHILEQSQELRKKGEIIQESRERCEELETILQTAQQQSVPETFGEDRIKSVHTTPTKVKHVRGEHEPSRKRCRPNSLLPDEEENILDRHMGDLTIRAGYFTVLDDGDFDLNMAASFVSYIGHDGNHSQLRSFFDHAIRDRWFCLDDVAGRGKSALGLDVKKCSQHKGNIRCILVMVTTIHSVRHLRFTYEGPEAADF
ncbi:hypothetical protein KAF25_003037 [Fusarium avenaceum]|uniref:Uncharacterized protein n=1 Tax=Fusarium avenaceum TaxID=40199 RepID=A0A9P7KP34_9HYPO|nr:hypothetical protein KAF25_003037 [Fusarium avenaceum]